LFPKTSKSRVFVRPIKRRVRTVVVGDFLSNFDIASPPFSSAVANLTRSLYGIPVVSVKYR